jgi:hypothetical protein
MPAIPATWEEEMRRPQFKDSLGNKLMRPISNNTPGSGTSVIPEEAYGRGSWFKVDTEQK